MPYKYTAQFRKRAVRRVVEENRAIAEVARELRLEESTLGRWTNAYRKERAAVEPPPSLTEEQARVRELEQRNQKLEMENSFLRRAAAYFAGRQR